MNALAKGPEKQILSFFYRKHKCLHESTELVTGFIMSALWLKTNLQAA